MKCSFIVPVYNVEKYLKVCIDSVINQSIDGYEIILVDDGSTDSSGIICDRYVQANPKIIKCIHQNNMGQSHARNIGISVAKGDYIMFLDSDDYIGNSDFLRMVLPDTTLPDVIVFSWKEVPDGENEEAIQPNRSLMKMNSYYATGKDYLCDALSYNHAYSWYPWKYLFKRSFWMQQNFRFVEGTKYEDVELMYRVLLNAKLVSVIGNVIGYCYRTQRKGSTVFQVNTKTYNDMLRISYGNIVSLQKSNMIDCALKKLLLNNFSLSFYSVMTNMGLTREKEKRQYIIGLLGQYRGMCKYTIDIKYYPLKLMIQLFGVSFSALLLGIRTRMIYGVRD